MIVFPKIVPMQLRVKIEFRKTSSGAKPVILVFTYFLEKNCN